MGTVVSINEQQLDNTIKLIPTDQSYSVADNGIVRSEFYETGNRVVFISKGRRFSWTPNSMKYIDEFGTEDSIYNVQDVPLETKANYARFNRAFPDVDDWFIVENDRLKHQILVQGFHRDPLPWLFGNIDFVFGGRIEFDSDLGVRANGLVITGPFETGGNIEIIDADGNALFTLPQIVAYDSKILERAMTYGKYRVNSNENGILQFDIAVDNAWISSVDRVYPVLIDPTVVVSAAYDTSGNGGRKTVKLSNGWLVCGVWDSAGSKVRLYKSADNGATWTQLCYYGAATVYDYALVCYGTMCYLVVQYSSTFVSCVFDAITVTNTDLPKIDIDNSLSGQNGCSIAINGAGTELHATLSGIVSTRPDSKNIRYCKGTISVDSVTWGSVEQVTTYNTGVNLINPSIVIKISGNPVILFDFRNSSGAYYGIYCNYRTTSWLSTDLGRGVLVYGGYTYIQSNSCAVVDVDGYIPCVWQGYGATHTTTYHVFFNRSTDGGANWGTLVDVAVGQKPTISYDNTGKYYVKYDRSGKVYQKTSTDGGANWSAEAELGNGSDVSAMEREVGSIIGYIWKDTSAGAVQFDKTVLNLAPNAPTLTTKANYDATADGAFSWTFSDDNVGDTQSAYQLQIREVGLESDAVDTGKMAGTSGSHTVSGATLTNNKQYQWRVKTWDELDEVGPYSDYSTFYTSAAPTVTITSPVNNGDTVSTSNLTVNWTFSDAESEGQSAYQLQLTDNSDAVLWDSAKTSDTTARSRTASYDLENSTAYKAKLTVWDAKDVPSTEAVRTFSVAFTPPATPTITATGQGSYITISITNPAETPPEPEVSSNYLYRRISGETAWTRIAMGIAENGSYNDYAVASGTTYEYKARAVGSNETTTDSTTASASITLSGSWLFDVTNQAGTIIQLKCYESREQSWEAEGTLMQFAGRSKPIMEFGESETSVVNVSVPLLRAGTEFAALQALVRRKATLCFRDERSRKVFGVIRSLPVTDERAWGYTIQLKVDEIDYSEVV